MRSVDSINGEIGQLKHRVSEIEHKILTLEQERSESLAAAKGLYKGQLVEYPYGQQRLTGHIIGFGASWGGVMVCTRILKNGKTGGTIQVHGYDWDKVKVIEDAPKGDVDNGPAR